MKQLIVIILLITLPGLSQAEVGGCSTNQGFYLDLGLGYKFSESDVWYDTGHGMKTNHPISASGEFGYQWDRVSMGLRHDSQLLTGWPFDDQDEYYKTELFVSYRIWF